MSNIDSILLTRDEIPVYLHNSEFYNMLESNDPFEILTQYYDVKLEINTITDIIKYF